MKIFSDKAMARLRAAYYILTGKWGHWVLINVDDENVRKLLNDDEFDAELLHCGTNEYVYFKMIKNIAETKDETDMIVSKLEFEMKVENNL